jgi:hypothetical protein
VKSKNRGKDKGESSGGKSANTLLRVDRKDFSPERDKRQGTGDKGQGTRDRGQGTRDREIKTRENQPRTSLGSLAPL